MARLKYTLRASSVIEAIVASTVFMTVFVIAMDSVAKAAFVTTDASMLTIEVDRRACIHEFTYGSYAEGSYRRAYEWGDIEISIAPYKNMENIMEMRFEARIRKNNRRINHRMLIVRDDV